MLTVSTQVIHLHSHLHGGRNTDAGMCQTYIYPPKSILESLIDNRQRRMTVKTRKTFMQNPSVQFKVGFFSDYVYCFISLTPVATFLFFFPIFLIKLYVKVLTGWVRLKEFNDNLYIIQFRYWCCAGKIKLLHSKVAVKKSFMWVHLGRPTFDFHRQSASLCGQILF